MSEHGPLAGAAGTDASDPDPAAEERDAWAILAGVSGLGPVGLSALLDQFGSGREVLRVATSAGGVRAIAAAGPTEDPDAPPARRPISVALATAIADAALAGDLALARIRALGLTVVTVADPAYPVRLARVELPPHLLFVLGDPAALQTRHAVAVVGTRRPSSAGRAFTARLAGALVSCDATVVSGLAVGIDGAAHDATVASGGTTVAVIGGGHGSIYPRAHQALADAIVRGGGAVVSELAPDAGATKGTFPRRNRVISGLSDATVVVEAPARSGALITASWALEQGRECFLVPGLVGAATSDGCLAFLREFPGSARIVAGIPQLLDDLGLAPVVEGTSPAVLATGTIATLGRSAGQIADALVRGLTTVDELVAATGSPVATVLAALTILERDGLAVGVHGRFRPAGTLAAQRSADPRRRGPALARSNDPMLP